MKKRPPKIQLEAWRKLAGLTQVELARAAKTSRNTVGRIETEPDYNPTFATIRRLAVAVGALEALDLWEMPPGTLVKRAEYYGPALSIAEGAGVVLDPYEKTLVAMRRAARAANLEKEPK
jgi:transcriptional regulator with XRE-family HTH domain